MQNSQNDEDTPLCWLSVGLWTIFPLAGQFIYNLFTLA